MDVGLLSGLANALTLANIGFALIGCLLGTLVGILPGLGPASAMAILLPVALYLPPDGAIIIMAGIYYGAMYGGSTTAILMNIPGEVASVITAQDGFAMTKQGRAGEALAIAAIGSYLAGMLGTLAIAVLGPKVADLALRLRAARILRPGAVLDDDAGQLRRPLDPGGRDARRVRHVARLVGTDPLTGTQRLNFGTMELMKGFDIVPVLIGLFGIGEVLASLEQKVDADLCGQARLRAVDDPARGRARARHGRLRARHGRSASCSGCCRACCRRSPPTSPMTWSGRSRARPRSSAPA